MREQLAVVATGSVLLLTCSETSPRMEVTGVTPDRVRVRVVTVATVEGRNFHNDARVALDDRRPEVNRTWHFKVPDVDTVPYEATYVDSETVQIVLPASLPVGTHDLELTAPSGASDRLEDAFTVEPRSAGGAGGAEAQLAAAGAGGADETGGEAGAAGLAVAEPGPFDPPTPVTLGTAPTIFDDDPSFTDDLLELYFSSNRAGGAGSGDIWVARRASASDPWGTPERIPVLSSAGDDALPSISGDGLRLWFCSSRPGTVGNLDIWVTTRPDRQSPWDLPLQIPELNSTALDCGRVSPGGFAAVITSDRPGGVGMRDLYLATHDGIGLPWTTPTLIPNVNTAADESEGRIMADGLRLYFSSNRGATGNYDIYAAMRSSTSEDFGLPVAMTSLNSLGIDRDPWLSQDLSYIMFTSDRDGVQRIYEAYR